MLKDLPNPVESEDVRFLGLLAMSLYDTQDEEHNAVAQRVDRIAMKLKDLQTKLDVLNDIRTRDTKRR